MRLIGTVSVFILCAIQPAFGADNNQAFNWTGAYLGGSAGYGWGKTSNSWTNDGLPAWEPDGRMKYDGLVGGVHLGIQHQYQSFVLGLEGDFDLVNLEGDDAAFAGVVNEIKIKHAASARARLGWASDQSLFYATGGLAYGSISKRDITLLDAENSTDAVGWTAGAGYERSLSENWILRAEYRHTDFGSAETLLRDPLIGAYSHRADSIKLNVVRLGASYKF